MEKHNASFFCLKGENILITRLLFAKNSPSTDDDDEWTYLGSDGTQTRANNIVAGIRRVDSIEIGLRANSRERGEDVREYRDDSYRFIFVQQELEFILQWFVDEQTHEIHPFSVGDSALGHCSAISAMRGHEQCNGSMLPVLST